jgi:hypothetical protein
VTVTTNGHKPLTQDEGRDIVRATDMPRRPVLAATHGMSESWWRDRIAEVRNGAAVAVPPVGADSPGEVTPVARSNVKPHVTRGTLATSTNARRQRHLIVVMWVVASLVAGAVGTLSYSLIQTLAAVAGAGWHAYIVPMALDGMYLCGAICLAIDPKYRPAKIAIGVGLVASMATNWVAAYDPSSVVDLELVARTLLSVTPLTLFLCVVFILHAYKVRR